MPRPPLITPDAVDRAAQALVARGQTVTNQAIHAILGRGSMSTLVPLVRAWKDAQKERAELDTLEIPEEVLGHARDLAGRIWRDALAEASVASDALRREYRASQQKAAETQSGLLDTLNEAEVRHQDLEREIADLRSQIEALRSTYDAQALDLARAQSTIEALKEKVAMLEGTVTKAEARAERAEERLALVAQGAAGTAPRRP